MNVVYDFNNLYYFKFHGMQYYAFDSTATYTKQEGDLPFEIEAYSIDGTDYYNAYLCPTTAAYVYDYTNSEWDALIAVDENIFNEYIIGVDDGVLNNTNNDGDIIEVVGSIVHEDLHATNEFYVFNNNSPLISYLAESEPTTNEYAKLVGKNAIWNYYSGAGPYTSAGVALGNNRYSIDQITDTAACIINDGYITYNNATTTPLIISPLKKINLPSSYTINKIYVDYLIEDETDDNSIKMHLVDEDGTSYIYDTTTEEWISSSLYQDIETINTYLDSFDSATRELGWELEVTSDDNDINLYRVFIDISESYANTNKVTLSGNIVSVLGVAVSGLSVYINPSIPQNGTFGGSNILLYDTTTSTTTNTAGYFSFDVPANISVFLTIANAGIRKTITVESEDIDLGSIVL